MTTDPFLTEISRHIWDSKYRFRDGDQVHDRTVDDTWHRVARTLAAVEKDDGNRWENYFYEALRDFRFLPGGRIQAGAGTGRRVTLFNCFAMGTLEDSMDGIFDGLKEGALTMQQGGGVGYDFSTLRPSGTQARSVGTVASGPVSFMQIWDAMCGTLLSTGARRGAMMATLRCDHPDIEMFIAAKRDSQALRRFNLSVLVTDAFMEAVHGDRDWALVFPQESSPAGTETVMRPWSGAAAPIRCRIHRRVRARELWDKLMRATYEYAEPGVLFIDRINQANNLWYREQICTTNPCGEIPLPPYGACDLGSLNLTAFVHDPFTDKARLDLDGISKATAFATRMMDNVIDASQFPLDKQAAQARGTRRIGLGLTGLADTLIMLGLHYAEKPARELAARVMQAICHSAYRTSIALAEEKGAFPFFDREKFLKGKFIQSLPHDIRDGISRYGLRNSHLTAIAPTGTISLLANNISSGLEPVYKFNYVRRVLELDGRHTEHRLTDFALQRRREREEGGNLPPAFVDAGALAPSAHLGMQSALQPYVDNSISKTINVPREYRFEDFKEIYQQAYDLGLKGCTTFRPNPVTGEVLREGLDGESAPHCCTVEREAD
ncbi:MAG: adenosylcobalamin-dependent ribonucleoside-diphosphate reductase [Gammaproteobacteria bacterium]|nr:adenosylcobalamin-dependent ribonucleoside-diphosphate reductase [Gammaproteobacteria bacterium]MDH3369960.1 adenosylcobalamin-dependent ribonucleoside-diphosphate reductase [Gammaproteobacteria bacterium]MDH3406700.1 adenosylcobalamin-dependent ribonucleoside-diphosphate reductase [Gammaproteobacteria bacterium]MDH5487101.1 adenosylcobalamin-dependent ribonucleoside-diphosphate reductase [Gammaproteobacteria bacterium]